MTEEKGLPAEVADRIGEYVTFNGGLELIDKLRGDARLYGNAKAKEGIEEMAILLNFCNVMGILDKVGGCARQEEGTVKLFSEE